MIVVILVGFILLYIFSLFPPNINPWLIATFWIIINALDSHSTKLFLKQGVEEGNPLMSWLFKNVGFTPTIVLKMIAAILIAYLVIVGKINSNSILAVSIVFTWVVINNYKLARTKVKE